MAAAVSNYRQDLKIAYLDANRIEQFYEALKADMKAKELLKFYRDLPSFQPLPTKHHVQFYHTVTTVTVAWSNGSKINEVIRNGMRKHLKEISDALKEIFEVKDFSKNVSLLDFDKAHANYLNWRKKNRLCS